MRAKNKSAEPSVAFAVLKGALIASAISLVLILVYALALKLGWLGIRSMGIITPVIKVLGAAAAAIFATRKCQRRRWLVGAIAGLAFVIFSFMVFSILSSSFNISVALLADVGVGLLSGALSAIIMSVMHR